MKRTWVAGLVAVAVLALAGGMAVWPRFQRWWWNANASRSMDWGGLHVEVGKEYLLVPDEGRMRLLRVTNSDGVRRLNHAYLVDLSVRSPRLVRDSVMEWCGDHETQCVVESPVGGVNCVVLHGGDFPADGRTEQINYCYGQQQRIVGQFACVDSECAELRRIMVEILADSAGRGTNQRGDSNPPRRDS